MAAFLLQAAGAELEITKKLLAAAPADKMDFKLGEKGRTLKDLLQHTAGSEIWFLEAIAKHSFGDPEKPVEFSTPQELVEKFTKARAESVAKVEAMSGEDLATPVDFFGVANFPSAMYLLWMINHTVHHRGQLSAYLRALNAHVPSIYGGSADEPWTG